jgi:hypothetical protein
MDRTALEGPHGALEHGSFVESHPGLHQQFPILLFERHPTVMFFLPLDVFDQAVDAALRTRKHDVIGDGGEGRHRTIGPQSTPAALAGPFTPCP